MKYYELSNYFSLKRNFEDDFSAKTEMNARIKTKMAAGYLLTRESQVPDMGRRLT